MGGLFVANWCVCDIITKVNEKIITIGGGSVLHKRILTIQDISCLGQCSMTVALPVLSVCGHETCILPSKLLSTHTGGFGMPVVQDLSAGMEKICDHWQSQGIAFDAVYTGYLGSVEAIHAAEQIVDSMLAPGGVFIADPAMADDGKLYAGLDDTYAQAMIQLCRRADVVIPNMTEAAMMTQQTYREDPELVAAILPRFEGQSVVLTGVSGCPEETGVVVKTDTCVTRYSHKRIARSFHGTGDLFASCFTGAWLRGLPMETAASVAAEFTYRCVKKTWQEPAHGYGVRFEAILPELIKLLEK